MVEAEEKQSYKDVYSSRKGDNSADVAKTAALAAKVDKGALYKGGYKINKKISYSRAPYAFFRVGKGKDIFEHTISPPRKPLRLLS